MFDSKVEHKKHRTNLPWKFGGVREFFGKKDDLAYLLEPMLLALEWDGEYIELVESLPHYLDELTLTSFLNVMQRLGYRCDFKCADLVTEATILTPFLFIPNDASKKAMVVLDILNDKVCAIRGEDGGEVIFDKKDMFGKIFYFFRPLETVRIAPKDEDIIRTKLLKYNGLGGKLLLFSLLYNILMLSLPMFIFILYDLVIPSAAIDTNLHFLFGGILFLALAHAIDFMRLRILAYVGAKLDKQVGQKIVHNL